MGGVIIVQKLNYQYRNSKPVLNNISLNITSGEFLAIVGENGAGKTTLVKHFNGLLKPTSGRVLVSGIDTTGCKVSKLAYHVGYVFQNPDHQIFHDTVEKEVSFGLTNLDLDRKGIKQRVQQALAAVSLERYSGIYPYDLSRGQRQRVALASVLAMQPEVIVLDEPTTGQDYREAKQIMDILQSLNQRGHTIIFITHDMTLVAEYAQRVIVMGNGEIILDGTVRQVFSHPDILHQTMIELPPVTRLANKIHHLGIPKNILSVEEAYITLRQLLKGRSTND